jgi:hypothetical protein
MLGLKILSRMTIDVSIIIQLMSDVRSLNQTTCLSPKSNHVWYSLLPDIRYLCIRCQRVGRSAMIGALTICADAVSHNAWAIQAARHKTHACFEVHDAH